MVGLPPLANAQMDRASKDDPTLMRANRLTAVAKAVGALDLNAIAASFRTEAGICGVDVEPNSAAEAAMSAAIRSSMAGKGGTEAAEREVRLLAHRRARHDRTEAYWAAEAEEAGAKGFARREAAKGAIEARALQAVDSKVSLIKEEAARCRADRENRFDSAANRRALAEARARAGVVSSKQLAEMSEGDGAAAFATLSHPMVINDPAIQRARALCSNASRVIADLEQQSQLMRARAQASQPMPRARSLAALPGSGAYGQDRSSGDHVDGDLSKWQDATMPERRPFKLRKSPSSAAKGATWNPQITKTGLSQVFKQSRP